MCNCQNDKPKKSNDGMFYFAVLFATVLAIDYLVIEPLLDTIKINLFQLVIGLVFGGMAIFTCYSSIVSRLTLGKKVLVSLTALVSASALVWAFIVIQPLYIGLPMLLVSLYSLLGMYWYSTDGYQMFERRRDGVMKVSKNDC